MAIELKLTGFETLEQAKGLLAWFEGQGEQDDTIPEWTGGYTINCNVKKGMIITENSVSYEVEIYD